MLVQNHSHTTRSRRTYVRDVRQLLLNPAQSQHEKLMTISLRCSGQNGTAFNKTSVTGA